MERTADSSDFVPTFEQIPTQVKLDDLQILFIEIAVNGINTCTVQHHNTKLLQLCKLPSDLFEADLLHGFATDVDFMGRCRDFFCTGRGILFLQSFKKASRLITGSRRANEGCCSRRSATT